MTMLIEVDAGQSGEAHVFLTQDNNLTAKVPLRRSILQFNLRQKYRSTGKHNPQRDDGPEKGLYRLHPIALNANLFSILLTKPFVRSPGGVELTLPALRPDAITTPGSAAQGKPCRRHRAAARTHAQDPSSGAEHGERG